MSKGWNSSFSWLSTVPPDARLEIRQIIGSLHKGGNKEMESGRWWVRLMPSTGTAHTVTLIERNSIGAPVRQWLILERGELVSARDKEQEAA